MNGYILLVDENLNEHDFFRQEIDRCGVHCRLLSAFNLKVGLRIIRAVHPDMVFIHYNRDDSRKLEFLQRAIREEKFPGMSFYLYSDKHISVHESKTKGFIKLLTYEMKRSLTTILVSNFKRIYNNKWEGKV